MYKIEYLENVVEDDIPSFSKSEKLKTKKAIEENYVTILSIWETAAV